MKWHGRCNSMLFNWNSVECSGCVYRNDDPFREEIPRN